MNNTHSAPTLLEPYRKIDYFFYKKLGPWNKIGPFDILVDQFVLIDYDGTAYALPKVKEKHGLAIRIKTDKEIKFTSTGKLKHNLRYDVYDKSKLTIEEAQALVSLAGKITRLGYKSYNTIVSEMYTGAYHYSSAYPAPQDKPEFQVDLKPERPVPGPVDDEIYEYFFQFMETLREDTSVGYIGHTKKTGPCRAIDRNKALTVRMGKKHDSTLSTPIAVGILPKFGPLTSSGNIRKIYPMSISLQQVYEKLFGSSKVKLPPHIHRVYGPKFPRLHRYTYDVKGMDETIYPYLYKYASHYDLLDIFLPVICHKTTGFIAQMPSGIYPTAEICTAFTAAIVTKLKVEAFIQGDGIMTNVEIEHPYLRQDADYTINGFCYRYHRPVYTRAMDKLNSPRMLSHCSSHATEVRKRHLREAIYYNILNARSNSDADYAHAIEMANYNPFARLSDAELRNAASTEGVCNRLLRFFDGLDQEELGQQWDAAPTTIEICKPHDDLPWCAEVYYDKW
jgi:hypothetical protein